MSYAGIDYGHRTTNIDRATGIRYGVIPANGDICQAWCDSAEAIYPEIPEGEELDDCCEPLGYEYRKEGYSCEQSQDDPDVFVIKSPFFTYASFCSPCAPGACYLLSPNADGAKAYCLGHDWFENGKAPYPVYSVETGLPVEGASSC
jgi:hypothetical protein